MSTVRVRLLGQSMNTGERHYQRGDEFDLSEKDCVVLEAREIVVRVEVAQRQEQQALQPSAQDLAHDAQKREIQESERLRAGALQRRLADQARAHAELLEKQAEVQKAAADRVADAPPVLQDPAPAAPPQEPPVAPPQPSQQGLGRRHGRPSFGGQE